ncbi:hypothetical protein ABT112_26620 [Streptomyces sp. NPDC002055]|uniref:hypothetical protein n=1 Tax=Streptomyces sp. NPDC002055 TaxID=3154534 RepID=UPI003316D8D4
MKSTDDPDGLLCPCMQVAIGYEQTELVNGLEGLTADSEGLRPGCHVRWTVPFLVLAMPPVVLTPYEVVGRSGESEDGAAALAPVCHTLLELVPQKRTDECSRHSDKGRQYLTHCAGSLTAHGEILLRLRWNGERPLRWGGVRVHGHVGGALCHGVVRRGAPDLVIVHQTSHS